ncbi:MAG: TylF/MycF/NovP-related O-methyltransferase [Planctomycetota bacterium]
MQRTFEPGSPERLYIDLLKACVSRAAFGPGWRRVTFRKRSPLRALWAPLAKALGSRSIELVQRVEADPSLREQGRDVPFDADTMLGQARLQHLVDCCIDVLRDDVPGDFIETGVWRGGACILMRGALAAAGDRARRVWVADSFQGLPPPDPDKYPADAGDLHHVEEQLRVTADEVRERFARYGLLDDQVRFLQGWFKDTLPGAPIERLAIARLDGDMYESTMDAITALYPKLSVGGWLIVDDYGAVEGCKKAIADYRAQHDIREPIVEIDWTGAAWRRAR